MTIPRRILALLTPAERKRAMVLLVFMVVGMVLETIGIGSVIPAMALLTQPDLAQYPPLQPVLTRFGNPTQRQLVTWGMVALVGINVVKAVGLAFLTWQRTKFAFEVQASISQRLFATYLGQPYAFHLQRNSAQLIRNAMTEVSLFTGVLSYAMLVVTESLVLVGLATLLLIIEPLGAVIVGGVLAFAAWGFHRVTRGHIAKWGRARQLHEGLRIQHLQQGLGGVKDVKLLGREATFLAEYWRHNAAHARVSQLQQTMFQIPMLWMELLGVAGLALLVITMLAQGRPISALVPTLGLFAAAAFRLTPSVNRLLGAVQSVRFGVPVINTLYHELALTVPATEEHGGRSPTFRSDIAASNVTYTYPGAAAPSLRNVSLTIRKNETVGFIGASGSGKTTLVDTVLGLLTPDEGRVLVDDEDIQQNVRKWQDQMGYVSQAIYLTDDTLRRNVAVGIPSVNIDENAVRRAIKAAQLEDFVSTLPDGLDTMVGERGIRLSGGQRQRIGIARALYHDPPVLVLDEATSSLDTDTERGVMDAVVALHGNKTVLIVAHRVSTVAHCDRVYRLEHGRLVAEGTSAAMLSASPS